MASLFKFRRRPGWQKLGVVSFAWPLVPTLFVIPGVILVVVGVQFAPVISAAVALTLISGALVYHFRIKGSAI